MRHPAEVFHRAVELSGSEMSMRRAPEAKVDNGANAASFQKFFPVRPHVADFRNDSPPCLGQASLPQVLGSIRVTKRRAQPEFPVMTHIETAVAGAAMEEMIAGRVTRIGQNEFVAAPLHRAEPVLIGAFERDDFGGVRRSLRISSLRSGSPSRRK